jgi:hypothetical protein
MSSQLCFFWDMQNCPVPSKGSPYECVSRIRAAVLMGEKTAEVSFNAYCDVGKLSQDTRQELGRARVIIRDVPSQKPAASDIRLLQDMLHHTMTHRSGIIVLISGDIDFAETVHDLVHTGGYKVILIHNRQARPELCKNASKALRFEDVVGGVGTASSGVCGVDAENPKAKGDEKGVKKKDDRKETAKSTVKKVGNDEGKTPTKSNTDPKKKANDGRMKPETKKKMSMSKKQTWPCESCGKKFLSQDARDSHVEATGHSIRWSCEECEKSFQSEKGLEQHQDATGHDQICCSECQNKFNSLRSLSQHLDATGHGNHLCWRCPHCDSGAFDRLKDLLDHLRLDH